MSDKLPETLRLNLEIENVKLSIDLNDGFFGFAANKLEMHSHKYYEFHHIISGSMRLVCDNCEYSINQNETYIVTPNVLHCVIPIEDKSQKSSFCFSFSKLKKKINFDLYDLLETAFGTFKSVSKVPVTSDQIFFLNKILSLFYSDKKIDRFKVKTYFILLLTAIAESLLPSENSVSTESGDVLSEDDVRHFVAEEFVRRNFDKNISLCDLSTVLHLSEKQTGRIFYKEFGQTFKEYLVNIRLASAKSLLSETTLPVQEVSQKVGYGTYNGFYTMFLNKTGISPLEYRINFHKDTDITIKGIN